jgi:hypothetical protein
MYGVFEYECRIKRSVDAERRVQYGVKSRGKYNLLRDFTGDDGVLYLELERPDGSAFNIPADLVDVYVEPLYHCFPIPRRIKTPLLRLGV